VSGVVLDTSIYGLAIRRDRFDLIDSRSYPDPLYYSAVVGEELFVGATSRTELRERERLWRSFEQRRRLVVPNATDWCEAGLVLGEIGQQLGYDQVGRARMTNNALIAVSAHRLGLTVVTANRRDFEVLARYRPFRLSVIDA
jgi:predicted nucleic acid-binding protein